MEVIAIKKGFYGKIRNCGDIFEIKGDKEFGSWMELSPGEVKKQARKRQVKKKAATRPGSVT